MTAWLTSSFSSSDDDVGRDRGEKIEHVLRVEADLHRRAGVVDRQRFLRFAELRAARRDVDLALVDLKLHRARSLVRQQRHALDRVGQPIALELDVLVVALRNDALVGGKLAVDHPRDQHAAADLEEQVVLAALVADVAVAFARAAVPSSPSVFFGRIALTLVGVLLAPCRRASTRHQRQAMAVGRDQAHRVGPQHEQRAVQEIPRVLAGDRKLRLRDHLLQRRCAAASAVGAPPASGSVGKSSRGSVCIRESNRSAATFTPPLSSAMRMSVSGSDLTIS